jgi:4-hydroxybenzoate polyprenyltransferase
VQLLPDKPQRPRKLPSAAEQKRQRTNQAWVLLVLGIALLALLSPLWLLLIGALLVLWLIIWFVKAEIDYNRPRR